MGPQIFFKVIAYRLMIEEHFGYWMNICLQIVWKAVFILILNLKSLFLRIL